MIKKFLCCLIVLSLFLAACAKEEEPTTAPTEAQETEPTVESATEPVTEPETEPVTEPATEPQDVKTVKVSIVGDCLLSSYLGTHEAGSYNAYADELDPSYFFEGVQSVFAADDITIANCETVFTDRALAPSYKEEDPAYWYYGPSHNAAAFAAGSVEVASVANNHAYDYGVEGYNDTVAALESHGVLAGQDAQPVYVSVGDFTVGILCCNVWGYYQSDRACEILGEMSAVSDVQIVLPHGGVMGTYVPDEWRVYCFRQMIDAGAEVVAGAHPHKLQPMESYNGGAICYSLGDFCFGDAPYHENATVIMTVEFTFVNGVYQGLTYDAVPAYLYTEQRNNFHPALISMKEKAFYYIKGFMLGGRDTPI